MKARALFATALIMAVLALPASAGTVKSLPVVKGAQVWFAEDHTVPVIAMTVSFPAGSAYDPPTKAGLAAFAAAMLDQGAGTLDGLSFQSALADSAVSLAASADRDDMTVTLYTLSSNARQAFHLLALALGHPRFDPEPVARVREQLIQSNDEDQGDPGTVAENGFYSFYFGAGVYGHPVEGDKAGLDSVTTADLRKFVRDHWVRAGLKIAVAGDIDAAMLKSLLRATFASLPGDAPPPVPAAGLTGAPGLHVLAMEVPEPVISFGLPGPQRSGADYLPALIANYILGGGEDSRLDRRIREERGLTYDVSSTLLTYRKAGLLLGHVSANPDSVEDTVDLVRDTFRRFAVNGPTNQELADAKTYLNGAFPLASASDAELAAQLNELQCEGQSLDYLDKRADLINAVTLDDVRRVSRRYFAPDMMTIIAAGPKIDPKTQASR